MAFIYPHRCSAEFREQALALLPALRDDNTLRAMAAHFWFGGYALRDHDYELILGVRHAAAMAGVHPNTNSFTLRDWLARYAAAVHPIHTKRHSYQTGRATVVEPFIPDELRRLLEIEATPEARMR